jgi:transcriptional regulator with XRE-family HTH domain
MSSTFPSTSVDRTNVRAHHLGMTTREGVDPRSKLPEPATAMGRRIVDRMQALGLSCNALDRRIGQTSGYTSPLIRGKKRTPEAFVLERMAGALGVTVDWLINGNQPRPTTEAGGMGTLIDSGARFSPVRYPSLEACIAFFHKRKQWEPWVLAAARAGYWADDCEPPDWEKRLDTLQAIGAHHRATYAAEETQ